MSLEKLMEKRNERMNEHGKLGVGRDQMVVVCQWLRKTCLLADHRHGNPTGNDASKVVAGDALWRDRSVMGSSQPRDLIMMLCTGKLALITRVSG